MGEGLSILDHIYDLAGIIYWPVKLTEH